MLSWVLTGAVEADVTPGLGVGVTGLGGPSGTRLGLPGCGGGHREAEDDEEEEDVVVVADSPNLGEAMYALLKEWTRADVGRWILGLGRVRGFRIVRGL